MKIGSGSGGRGSLSSVWMAGWDLMLQRRNRSTDSTGSMEIAQQLSCAVKKNVCHRLSKI